MAELPTIGLPFKEGLWRIDIPEQPSASHAPFIAFVAIDATGSTHRQIHATNDAYFSFDQEIVSPVTGEVVQVHTGLPDNPPDTYSSALEAFGNHVIIQHGNLAVYSILFHLKNGSIHVRAGMIIDKGDTVALCGNSGNSRTARLGYGLLIDRKNLYKPGKIMDLSQQLTAIPTFTNVHRVQPGGALKTVERYTPAVGDRIELSL